MFKYAPKMGVMALLLAGAAMTSAPVAAQDARDLDRETSTMRSFSGRVTDEPEVFNVSIPAGTALRIDVVATSELDPVLTVTNARTGELIVEDDDGGGDLNSRALVRGGDTGLQVRLSVRAFSFEGMEGPAPGGTFDLRLTSMTVNPQGVDRLSWGSSTSGTLNGDETHEFTFRGAEGSLLEVNMSADGEFSELDSYLELYNEQGEMVAFDDDSGGELNSRMRYVLPDDGTYRIVASTYGETEGDYQLVVSEQREPVTQAPLQTIGLNRQAEGRVGAAYDLGGIDPAYIDYQLSEAAIATIQRGNGEVTIHLTAVNGNEEFGLDPYLELGFDTPLGFAVVLFDDDGAGNLNSLLPVDLSEVAADPELLSRLRIRAQAFGGTEGNYEIEITEGLEERVEYIEEYIAEEPVFD